MASAPTDEVQVSGVVCILSVHVGFVIRSIKGQGTVVGFFFENSSEVFTGDSHQILSTTKREKVPDPQIERITPSP